MKGCRPNLPRAGRGQSQSVHLLVCRSVCLMWIGGILAVATPTAAGPPYQDILSASVVEVRPMVDDRDPQPAIQSTVNDITLRKGAE